MVVGMTDAVRTRGATGSDMAGSDTARSAASELNTASSGRSMSVVVTGAGGFIGSHLVEALLAAGQSVVGLDRHADREAANLAAVVGHPRFVLVDADLVRADLGALVAGADMVFHLAGEVGVRDSWGERFGDYAAANVFATQRVAEACVAAGVRRLVLASSSSVYGPASRRPSRETDRPSPRSPYAVSKLAAEHLALTAALRGGIQVVVLRYFTVYGPRQRPDMLVARALQAVLGGAPLAVFGDGRQRRAFTYVGDVVAATLLAARCPVRGTAVFNVAGGRPVTVLHLLELARMVCGHPVPVRWEPARDGDVEATAGDLSSSRRRLGFRPAVPLAEGLAAQWSWTHQRREQPSSARAGASQGGSRCSG
jgi:UDP-glucuronate 4-epimerase